MHLCAFVDNTWEFQLGIIVVKFQSPSDDYVLSDKKAENLSEVECKQCGNKWRPSYSKIRTCPKCNTRFWDRDKPKKAECNRCHYIWQPRFGKVSGYCPTCGTTH